MAGSATGRERLRPAVIVAITLPVLLAVVVAAIGITVRIRGIDGADTTAAPPADTGPLAVAPVDAPGAGGSECAALLAAVPAELPGDDDVLPSRPLAEPTPGVLAWAASPRPVVLRCGLPRPAELNPTSALLEINGVRWLQLTDTAPGSVLTTYVAVDRPVYVVLTAPSTVGSGPLQAVSDAVRETLPATAVAVR
ncbi:DUF3515 domain-containing protein [Pseudonocardia sp. H11422]|uniref:DUF3515 domain-containing protein n=1 Tax=Pseudonocardia sp. H11422 TaxID=2835866 RepID=UPI0027E37593|nr:DUF3515 domain-containing protein [Pseudonocardia sp. H11422]